MAEDDPIEQDFWLETEAAKKINGLFANRIYVQPLGDGMVRINLGEVLDEETSYHSAVVVTALQAKQFAQVIFNVASAILESEYAQYASPPATSSVPQNSSALAESQQDDEDSNGRP